MSSTALSSIDKISPFITWPFCCWHCWLLLLVFLHIIQESYSTWACREWAVVLLELTDSYRRLVRGYSHSFFILLSWLLWLYSSGFPFLPLTTLQTSMQALLPILWGWCSQGSILGVQLLCAFVAANPYFFSKYHLCADDFQIYILSPDLDPQATDFHILSIYFWTFPPGLRILNSIHANLNISYSPKS